MERKKQKLELYVHIPFCVRKCEYCDFLSFSSKAATRKDYADALCGEIRAVDGLDGYQVSSVFFGGGTPSLMPPEEIRRIMDEIKSRISFSEDAEISLEANPGTVTEDTLKEYRKAGFNRISFGCQSMSDAELKRLGRIHTVEEFRTGYRQAREAGFLNINVDLMSALPGQTYVDWERNLRMTAELEPEHISAYSLILEEGTPFYEEQDILELPDEDTERIMYENTHDILKEYGYEQYEISNYAKKGYACRHNIGYWERISYLGLGLGAASLMEEQRFSNTVDLKEYLQYSQKPRIIRKNLQKLSAEDAMEEFMILGLRMCRGVSEEDFQRNFGKEMTDIYGQVIEKYMKMGFLQKKDRYVALTRKGISVSNVIMADFLRE